MKSHNSSVFLKFNPVGQGLFSTGELTIGERVPFRWVYDCGTTSKQALLRTALDQFHVSCGAGKPRLGLVVVSHFDKDHISGLVSLLSRFSVGVLMIPCVPLWLRLVHAFGAGLELNSEEFQFCLNPVAYLRSLDRASIEKILIVPSGGGALESGEPRESTGDTEGDAPLTVSWDEREPTVEDQDADLLPSDEKGGNSVGILRPGSAVRVEKFWEFLPYNDASIENPPPGFVTLVGSLRDELLSMPSQGALEKLKAAYDEHFGSDGKSRNIISLFLYAGLVGGALPGITSRRTWFDVRGASTFNSWWTWQDLQRCSALYSGDGYLDTAPRLDRLVGFYGSRRISQCLCFQVMHHGARTNWHAGVAERIRPSFSVFSSDPENKKLRHPDGDVVKDFLRYGPQQVDSVNAFSVRVVMRWRA